MSLAGALGGNQAVAVAAIVSSCTVPLFNILAVIALALFVGDSGSKKAGIRNVLLSIVKNPLIIAVALGFVGIGIREAQMALCGNVVFSLKKQVPFLYMTLNNLKAIASPFALLVLGGQFEFSAVKGLLKEIVTGTIWRIVLAPR